jgi:hypothetical protein
MLIVDIGHIRYDEGIYPEFDAGISKWAGTQYFYPSDIVYSTGRNY